MAELKPDCSISSIDDSAPIHGDDVQQEIEKLRLENSKLKVEFDSQRAKMKDLFLQTENELKCKKLENEQLNKTIEEKTAELNELKTRLMIVDLESESNVESTKRKAAEEIASLQQLVQETLEESSSIKIEYKKLQSLVHHLQSENSEFKQQSPQHTPQQDSLSLSQLSAVTKKIGRKLGTDFFIQSTQQQEEESDHHEDTELLKSLVGPLEEEIKALKDKLRATDEELQRCKQGSNPPAEPHMNTCVMCRNYEAELVVEQRRVAALEAKVASADKSVERHKEDLIKEIGFRKDMEEKWNEKREEHKKLVAELSAKVMATEKEVENLHRSYGEFEGNMKKAVRSLSDNREEIQLELDRLQKENEHLVGKYTVHSSDYQNSEISLPNQVEELHEMVLTLQQDLIMEKIGKEFGEETCAGLRSDIVLLKEEIQNGQVHCQRLQSEIERYRIQFAHTEKYRRREKEALEKLESAKLELQQLQESKRTLESKNTELRSRVSFLQQELDTTETVQKDFVRLSQNLQMQLENIRDGDIQVRWQHEEDVEKCPGCQKTFPPHHHQNTGGGSAANATTMRKEHCRHCGQIFCGPCLSHVVNSGRSQQPSKVCDVCHTLLVKSSAPYFSTEAPHSPD